MFDRFTLLLELLLCEWRSTKELSRFDCKCLEDINLIPKDIMQCHASKFRPFNHHPSWDEYDRQADAKLHLN